MDSKKLIWVGLTIGGFVGGYIPLLWGDSAFSFASIIFSAIGGLAGIWAGYKLSN
jgi:hypothetical protein